MLFVKAGVFAIDNATADISNTYMYLGSGGTYADIVVNFTNGAEVTFADNTKMINDAEFGMNITIDNTSSLTLDSSSLTATSVTNSGALKVTSGDDKASTVNVGTLTGVMEVAGGTLSASTVGSSNNTAGNVMFTGDAALDGANVLYGVNKVVNGATLTVGGEVTAHYLLAGEDNYFAFGNTQETKGGIIDINGKVTAYQVNADANGVVNVNVGGSVNASIIAVENGEITEEGTESGKLNVAGSAQATYLNVFSGGTVDIKEGGTVTLGEHESEQSLLNVEDTGSVNVAGTLNVKGSGTISKGGTLTMDGGTVTVFATSAGKGAHQCGKHDHQQQLHLHGGFHRQCRQSHHRCHVDADGRVHYRGWHNYHQCLELCRRHQESY